MAARRTTDPAALLAAARGGDRAALARLLTMVEDGGASSQAVAAQAFDQAEPAYTVGITGAPGSGKSTLTDRLIVAVRTRGLSHPSGSQAGGQQVGVLAIDPSSPFTGGAILGDRVRMQGHASDDGVFIRSMATRGHLGGLSVAVPDAIRVLSAAGIPVVLVETVGVGQVEVEVAGEADTTVVVVNPGWGDAIQANKAGLLEIADCFVINKADRPGARETRRDLELMLDLTALGDWRPPILDTVASEGDGTDEVWDAIRSHRSHQTERGLLQPLRRRRLERQFDRVLLARMERIVDDLRSTCGYAEMIEALFVGQLDPYSAADRLLGRAGNDHGTVLGGDSPDVVG